jgi:ACS family glucarate transporter-like MFS transporter
MKTQQITATGDAGAKATGIRWSILAILFIVTTINYADRATISIAGPELKKLLGLSPVQMGFVFSAFAWSYVLAQLPGGWLLDRFGSKITYFFSIFLWSVFTMLMGTVGFLNAAVAIFCYIFIGGEIKRVELAPSDGPLDGNLLPREAAPFANNGARI